MEVLEKMKSNIITISREFGSGGRLVGRKLAERLGYKYYDKNLLEEIAAEKGYSREMMEEDEKRERIRSGRLRSGHALDQ